MSTSAFGAKAAEGRRAAGRNAIIDAAIELYAREGIDNVSVDDVANVAGISARSFYRYFPSKEHVFIAYQLRSAEFLPRAIASRPASESPIEAIFRAAIEWDQATEEAFWITTRITGGRPPAMQHLGSAVLSGFRNMVATAIEARWPERSDARLLAALVVAVFEEVSERATDRSIDRRPLILEASRELAKAFAEL